VSNTIFQGNVSTAVYLNDLASRPVVSGNRATGNGWNGIVVGPVGELPADAVFHADLPYVLSHLMAPAGGRLRIEPGAVLKFLEDGQLVVLGDLEAEGTPDRRIVLTSWCDDSAGGDTNNDGSKTSPAPGNWRNLTLGGSGRMSLSFADLRYGGNGRWDGGHYAHGMIHVIGAAAPTLSGLVISHSAMDGVKTWEQARPVLRSSLLTENLRSGVCVAGGSQPQLLNNTLVGNGGAEGAAVICEGSSPLLANNLIAFNTAGVSADADSAPSFSRNNLFGNAREDYSGPTAGTEDLSADPLFADPAVGDYRLTAASPCVDAGDNTFAAEGALDLGGGVRRQGGRVDIGAWELGAEAVFGLRGITPRRAANLGTVTVRLWGTRFAPGMSVRLVSAQKTLSPSTLTVLDAGEAAATFDLAGAPLGAYDVVAGTPDGTSSRLPGAFEVAMGQGPKLHATVVLPSALRPNRDYVAWVEYGNDGGVDMAPPLLMVSSPQNVLMRLSRAEPLAPGPVAILGIALDGAAGVLRPGARYRVPVFFRTGNGDEVSLTLRQTLPGASGVNWSALETRLRPTGLDPQGWSAVWSNLKAQLGASEADVVKALTADASYLAEQGVRVTSVRRLVRFALERASSGFSPVEALDSHLDAFLPGRGLPLALYRVASASLEQRFQRGAFGRGWSHSYDFALARPEPARVVVLQPGGYARVFTRHADARWDPSPGDTGALTEDGATWLLRERDGLARRFDGSGRLVSVEEPGGRKVTLAYEGSLLAAATHSDGQRLAFSYTPQGRISRVMDSEGRSVEYRYDAAGEHLTGVALPGGRELGYAYVAATGGKADHALAAVTYPDGSRLRLAYDGQGRLAERSLEGGAEPVRFAYEGRGTVLLTDARSAVRRLHAGPDGWPLAAEDPDGGTRRFRYDDAHRLTALEDAAGGTWELGYDDRGGVAWAQDPASRTLSLGFSPDLGRLAWIVDPRGNRTQNTFDGAGALAGVRYPDGATEGW
ncbi:MAG: right-handed parallel beta-helix repeat-containing protein, partial [Candidatus Methylomirabilales bacterium]